jgi:ATP-dependent Clp protease ATP-binding subunit ClpC
VKENSMVKTQIGIKFPGETTVFSWLKPEYQQVIALAIAESHRLGDHVVGTEHLLLGLIRQDTSIAAQALKSVGVTLDNCVAAIAKLRSTKAQIREFDNSFTPHAKEVLEKTLVFYRDINQPLNQVIGAESLLLAIIGKQEVITEEKSYTNYTAVQVLQNLEVNLLELTTQVLQMYFQESLGDESSSVS